MNTTLDKRDFPGATFPEWMHVFRASAQGDRYRIRVEAGLHYLRGNRLPYFSVTADIRYADGGWSGGCQHEEVLRHWPQLAPVVALHLSDYEGVPTHAEANGWYWLAGYYGGAGERYHGGNSAPTRTPEDCLHIFADHVRVPLEEARTLAHTWQRGIEYAEARPLFIKWAHEQRPRWAQEAHDARELLDTLAGSRRSEKGGR